MAERLNFYDERGFIDFGRNRRFHMNNRYLRDRNHFSYTYINEQSDLLEREARERKNLKFINRHYGKLYTIIYKNLTKIKFLCRIYPICSMHNDLYQILQNLFCKLLFKEKYSKTNENKIKIIEKLQSFVKCFPSIRLLEQYFDKIKGTTEDRNSEFCTIYVIIELLNLYYQKFDFPVFKNHLKLCKFALKFFSSLNDKAIEAIKERFPPKPGNYFISKYPINYIIEKEEIINKYSKLKEDLDMLFSGLENCNFTN